MDFKTTSITDHSSTIKQIPTLPYPALRLIQKYLIIAISQDTLLNNVTKELKRFVLYSNTLNPDHHSLRPSFIKDVNLIYKITMVLACTSYDELSTHEQNYISELSNNIVEFDYLWKKIQKLVTKYEDGVFMDL